MMKLAHYCLVLISICFVIKTQASKPNRRVVTIPVNVAWASNSLWTEQEILSRFKYTVQTYERACDHFSIQIQLAELVQIKDSLLLDIDDNLTKKSVGQIKKILSIFKTNRRPVILFIRKGRSKFTDKLTEIIGQAFTFDGPRVSQKFGNYPWNGFSFEKVDPIKFAIGNLDWNRFVELKQVHGVSIIGQGYSSSFYNNKSQTLDEIYSVDAHEIGHILLNDGSHRYTDNNIMGDGVREHLDKYQCEIISAYNKQNFFIKKTLRQGMKTICSHLKRIRTSDTPIFCLRH